MTNLIFEKPSLSPLPQRVGWTFFTAFFWLVWAYLWMPLVTLAIWMLGFYAYGDYIDRNVERRVGEVGHLAIVYTSVVCALGGSLLLWARIEFVRFHDVNRRTRPEPVGIDEIALYAQLPVEEVSSWSHARRLVLHHDSHGRVLSGEVRDHG